MTLERGTLLHKRYRIVEILGQGGMGSVYRAVDENLGVDVAVKENLFTTDEYARQFRLEAVILANLRHPNLPRVSDHFVVGEQGQYLVMDFIEGEDLRQRMERAGNISEDEAVQIGAAISDALMYLHTRKPPILHRDLKPGNVKISPDGHIFLVDFGLAKVVHGGQITTTGARAMTPGYSPPEQYGTARTDLRTDIYSLGATLYAALSGIIPEEGLARAMDNAELTPLRRRNSRVSRRLSAVIEKAMAVDPADRYQTAEEFKKALLGSKSNTERLTGRYTVAPPPPEPEAAKYAPGESGAERADSSAQRKPPPPVRKPNPQPVHEEKPFIPPGKRMIERNKRRVRGWILFLLLAAAALLSVLYFNPVLIPAEARGMIPFLPITATATSSPTPLPTATNTPEPTATATSVPPTSTPTKAATATLAATLAATEAPLVPPPGVTPTATVTPQGGGFGQVAFASDRSGVPQIYISDLSEQNVQPLTDLTAGACQPSWSPDGARLVFVSPCSGPSQIAQNAPRNTSLYLINADGSQLTPLTTTPGGDFEPAWSPDGGRIAFTSLRDGSMQLYSFNLADQSVTRLTNLGSGIEARQASWSPGGEEIAFAVRRVGIYQIWAMSANGENARQIIRSGQDYWDYFPTWSRDGGSVIFTQRASTLTTPAYQMSAGYNAAGGMTGVRQNMGQLPVEHVAVSPDGFWIMFQSMEDPPNLDLFFLTAAGADRTRLTSDPGRDFDAAWRPQGTP